METVITPAQAYWNQRFIVNQNKERFKLMGQAVGRMTDLTLFQWAQIGSFALELKPDLIIELGRGYGNSTCVFLEVARLLGGADNCKVVSLCLSDDFRVHTVPRLKKQGLIDEDWFLPLEHHVADIIAFDYERVIKGHRRILLFWDAHGFAIANCVLGKIMPLIAEKQHQVIMHDISDQRYHSEKIIKYNDQPLWSGNNWDGPRVVLGHISSVVEQAISAFDFTTRNQTEFVSSAHSFHTEIKNDKDKDQEMIDLLGEEFYSLLGHWFCFSLNTTSPRDYTFPAFRTHIPNNTWQSNLKSSLIDKKSIYIWGTSNSGILLLDCLKGISVNTDGFIDNDPSKQNTTVKGKNVHSPELLQRIHPFILVASSFVDEIRTQLENLGYQYERDYMVVSLKYEFVIA